MDGALIATEAVPEGGSAPLPEAPEIEGLTFVGWRGSTENVTGDTDVYALYAENSRLLAGDADCSGAVDAADLSYMSLCVMGGGMPRDNAFYYNADINSDGRVNMHDVTLLCKRLIG